MKLHAFESSDWAEAEQHGLTPQNTIDAIHNGFDPTKDLLPSLSDQLNIAVRPYFQGIIPEYGTGARTWDAEFIELWFDKTVPHGAQKTLESLERSVFHECNHAARWNRIAEDPRLLEGAISEGLATVFERDHARYQPLYGIYEDDATMYSWLAEIIAADSDWSKRNELFFDHKDGRRWIGYKTGTWAVDKAIKKSGNSVVELTIMSADEIIELASLS